MSWSGWITHDFSGFPSHILKPGFVVEVELVNCQHQPKGHAMFTVGQPEVTTDYDEDCTNGNPTDHELWAEPSLARCLANNNCTWRVARYQYCKPRAKSSSVEEEKSLRA